MVSAYGTLELKSFFILILEVGQATDLSLVRF